MLVLDPQVAELLIAKGADVNAVDEEGDTPLILAVKQLSACVPVHVSTQLSCSQHTIAVSFMLGRPWHPRTS